VPGDDVQAVGQDGVDGDGDEDGDDVAADHKKSFQRSAISDQLQHSVFWYWLKADR
jgi:hypothetical protein